MSKQKKWVRNPQLEQLTRESDELASRYWSQAASSRERAYKEWLNCIKKGADSIRSCAKNAK